jgi:hypothetical protein
MNQLHSTQLIEKRSSGHALMDAGARGARPAFTGNQGVSPGKPVKIDVGFYPVAVFSL